ncbi:MAG: hypothetical protein ABUL60_34430 [Myxococcales bacterium]
MKQRMKYVFVLALAAGSIALSACGDDDSSSDNNNGGSAGASGSKTGGSSPGGSSNKAGNNSGGKASAGTGAGGAADGGMGGTSEAGAGVGGDSAGAGGNVDMGGAAGASGAAGAAGAGGAGEPELVYACGSATLIQKKCSALVAANCDPATDCSDCVATATSDREAFQTDPPCDTCNAKWDAFDQCQVDALEGGDVFAGVECVDGYGADGNANCYPFLDDAIACEQYVGDDVNPHACPATWPPQ